MTARTMAQGTKLVVCLTLIFGLTGCCDKKDKGAQGNNKPLPAMSRTPVSTGTPPAPGIQEDLQVSGRLANLEEAVLRNQLAASEPSTVLGGEPGPGAKALSLPEPFIPHVQKSPEGQLQDIQEWQTDRLLSYPAAGTAHQKNNWYGDMAFLEGRTDAIRKGYEEGATHDSLLARYHDLQAKARQAEDGGDQDAAAELSRQSGHAAGVLSQWDTDHGLE